MYYKFIAIFSISILSCLGQVALSEKEEEELFSKINTDYVSGYMRCIDVVCSMVLDFQMTKLTP